MLNFLVLFMKVKLKEDEYELGFVVVLGWVVL